MTFLFNKFFQILLCKREVNFYCDTVYQTESTECCIDGTILARLVSKITVLLQLEPIGSHIMEPFALAHTQEYKFA